MSLKTMLDRTIKTKNKTSNVGTTQDPPTIKVDWLSKSSSLSQIYSSGLEYCFISKDSKQCCPMVLCKDFLQDALFSIHHDVPVSIYGFVYQLASCEPVDMAKMRIAIGNAQDSTFIDKIPGLLEFIHHFETKLRLVKTRMKLVSNPPSRYKSGVVVLESSNRWMLSPPMLSMYSLLIRVGFTHKIGDSPETTMNNLLGGISTPYQRNDKDQLRTAQKGIEKILKYGYARIFFKEPKKNFPKTDISTMHNNMGIVSFTTESPKVHIKHWFRDLDAPKDDPKDKSKSKKNPKK